MTNSTIQSQVNSDFELITSKTVERKVLVTSEMAQRWLKDHHHINRPLNEPTVRAYRDDMINGRWVYAADPVRFSVEGYLLDGEHRLTALALSPGTALIMLVVTGLPNESQMVMDQGRRRSAGQQINMHLGTKNATAVAAAVKLYIQWTEGGLFTKFNQTMSISRIDSWVSAHPDLVEVGCENIHIITRQTDGPPRVALAAFYRFYQIDPDQALVFFRNLASGVGLVEGDPLLALRNRLRADRNLSSRTEGRDFLGLYIQAWNHWRSHRRVSRLQSPKGGFTAENFPRPV